VRGGYISVGDIIMAKMIRIGRESEKKDGKKLTDASDFSSFFVPTSTFVALFIGFSSSKRVYLLETVS